MSDSQLLEQLEADEESPDEMLDAMTSSIPASVSKKARTFWDGAWDLALLQLAQEEECHIKVQGKLKAQFVKVAMSLAASTGKPITWRKCYDRLNVLLKAVMEKVEKNKWLSGVEVDFNEADRIAIELADARAAALVSCVRMRLVVQLTLQL